MMYTTLAKERGEDEELPFWDSSRGIASGHPYAIYILPLRSSACACSDGRGPEQVPAVATGFFEIAAGNAHVDEL